MTRLDWIGRRKEGQVLKNKSRPKLEIKVGSQRVWSTLLPKFQGCNYLRMAYIRCLHWHLLLIRTGIFLLSCNREKPQAHYLGVD